MRRIIKLNLFVILGCIWVHSKVCAQATDFIFSTDFSNLPGPMVQFEDGGVLMTSKEYKFGVNDSISAARFSKDGTVIWQKTIQTPSAEVPEPRHLTTLFDGGFLLVTQTKLCDAGIGGHFISRFNFNGDLLWSKFFEWEISYQVFLAPDSNLIGLATNKIFKLNIENGDYLWESPIDFPVNVRDIQSAIFPGTEDFLAIAQQKIYYFKRIGQQNGTPVYQEELAYSQMNPSLENNKILYYKGDRFVYENSGQIYMVEGTEANDFLLNIDLPFGLIDYNLQGDSLYILTPNAIIIYHMWVNVQWEFPLPPGFNAVNGIEVYGDRLYISGTQITGPVTDSIAMLYTLKNSKLWRVWSGELSDLTDIIPNPDIGIVDVKQEAPITLDTVWGTFDLVQNVKGGDFWVKVANFSTDTIEKLEIRISFDLIYVICIEVPAILRKFENLQIFPGNTAWLHFGDIDAPQQPLIYPQFCFWTAGPNQKADLQTSNDLKCYSMPVGVAYPEARGRKTISPNPASSTIRLYQNGHFRIFNSLGQLVKDFLVHDPEAQVDISALPPGVYWVHIGNYTEKLIIQP